MIPETERINISQRTNILNHFKKYIDKYGDEIVTEDFEEAVFSFPKKITQDDTTLKRLWDLAINEFKL